MSRLPGLICILLCVLAAAAAFAVSYEVEQLTDHLAATNTEIAEEAAAIAVLEAEWHFLNQPARLARLGAQHLGFAPLSGARLASIGAVPMLPPTEDGGAPAPAAATADPEPVAIAPQSTPAPPQPPPALAEPAERSELDKVLADLLATQQRRTTP